MEEIEKSVSYVEVPASLLSDEALSNLISEFVLREGTDYGRVEQEHSTKHEQVRKQIARGDVRIYFDTSSESATLLSRAEWSKLRKP